MKNAVCIAAGLAFAACATTPNPTGNSFSPLNDLYLCRNTAIANEPPSDRSRRVFPYTPLIVIRGVALLRAPVDGCLSSAFGVRVGGAGIVHDGLDLYTGEPRAVIAAGAGRVVWISDIRGYGLTLEIAHGQGVATRYAHLSSVASELKPGSRVGAGEVIAHTGRSGNATAVHLHYEIRLDGQPQDPLLAPG